MISLAQELRIRRDLGEVTVPEVEFVYIERHLDNFSAFDAPLTVLTAPSSGEAPSFETKLYCTQPGTKGDSDMNVHGLKVVAGRPKFVELLAGAQGSKAEGVKVVPPKKQVIGVYSCGPPKMMADVRAAVQGAPSSAAQVFYLHEETFEL